MTNQLLTGQSETKGCFGKEAMSFGIPISADFTAISRTRDDTTPGAAVCERVKSTTANRG